MSAAFEIGQWLHCDELEKISNVKEVILESLKAAKDASLVHGLVDFYIHSQSHPALDILYQVTEPHDKHLLDRINKHLESANRLQALMLLGHLVHKQVSCVYNITRHAIFSHVIKIIKEATDVPILVSAVLLITSVLPMVPDSVRTYLHDIFDGFSRLASFSQAKPVNVPDVYLIHLHVAVYSMFHRLYGMYPCHFLPYLRNIYSKDENQQVFTKTIMPMLERVRMHPLLVTANKDKEISRERWKQLDVHDIVVDCAKLSLDLIEGSGEAVKCPVVGHNSALALKRGQCAEDSGTMTSQPRFHLSPTELQPTLTDRLLASKELIAPKPLGFVEPDYEPIISQDATDSFFSPSQLIGMETPPPDTPNTSRPVSYTGVPESPMYENEARDKKRLSGLSISLAGIIPAPVVGGGSGHNSVPPSPLRPEFVDPTLSASRLQAIRKIDFQLGQPGPQVKMPATRTFSLDSRTLTNRSPAVAKETGTVAKEQHGVAKETAAVAKDQQHGVAKEALTHQASISDEHLGRHSRTTLLRQPHVGESSPTLQVEKAGVPATKSQSLYTHQHSYTPGSDTQDSTKKTPVHRTQSLQTSDKPDSGKSRPKLNTLVSAPGGNPAEKVPRTPEKWRSFELDIPGPAKVTRTRSRGKERDFDAGFKVKGQVCQDESAVEVTEDGASWTLGGHSEEITIPVKRAASTDSSTQEQSQSVPSIYELPHLIESLDQNAEEEADDEVSALTGSQLTDSSYSSSLEPPEVPLTAESVQMFMKKVNRIRFNSMNVGALSSSREYQRTHLARSSSCPDFEDNEDLLDGQKQQASSLVVASERTHVMDPMPKVGRDMATTPIVTSSVPVTSQVTIASQTSFYLRPEEDDDDENENLAKQEGLSAENMDAMFPYAHLIPDALHLAPFMQCYTCSHRRAESQNGEGSNVIDRPIRAFHSPASFNTQTLGVEKPYFSTLSPPEILDRYLQLGSQTHGLQAPKQGISEKHSLPLVSGLAWSDDPITLRGQVLLLHNQLMYERHKRELYAKRNRRLHGRIVRTAALEERSEAMLDQFGLQEKAIEELKHTVDKKGKQVRSLQYVKDDLEKQRDASNKKYQADIDAVKKTNAELNNEIKDVKNDRDKVHKELLSCKAVLFETEQTLERSEEQASYSRDLQAQMVRLNKELLLMGELQQKYQQRLGQVSQQGTAAQHDSFLLQSYKLQVTDSRNALDNMTVGYEACKSKLAQTEANLATKENNVQQLKGMLEEIKQRHKAEKQALEDKYTTQRRVQQSLQANIMDLNAQLQLAKHSARHPHNQPNTHEEPVRSRLHREDSAHSAAGALADHVTLSNQSHDTLGAGSAN